MEKSCLAPEEALLDPTRAPPPIPALHALDCSDSDWHYQTLPYHLPLRVLRLAPPQHPRSLDRPPISASQQAPPPCHLRRPRPRSCWLAAQSAQRRKSRPATSSGAVGPGWLYDPRLATNIRRCSGTVSLLCPRGAFSHAATNSAGRTAASTSDALQGRPWGSLTPKLSAPLQLPG
jgi:hypothetical protein